MNEERKLVWEEACPECDGYGFNAAVGSSVRRHRCAACLGSGNRYVPAKLLRAERDRLRAALEAVEWHELEFGRCYRCPWCGGSSEMGHKNDCMRQAALGVQ
mgnify:CR=1 FL=1